jgi:myo-inositol-1(or 4)-monophosphatase
MPSPLRSLAARLAVEAGTMVRDARRNARPDATTKSSLIDMVTEFDRMSEEMVVRGLLAERPGDGLVGEEGSTRQSTTGIVWHIDPIDGTTNYLYGLPGYAVSIAAVDPQGTLAGAVYIPSTDELFTADRGGGATMNGEPIHCTATTDMSLALVGTGFAYQPTRRADQIERVGRVLRSCRDLRRFGAAAADLCYVAAGRLDVYYEEFLSSWDMAAGELIAREAGCRLGALDGGPPGPGSLLVTTPALFDPMVHLLRLDHPSADAPPANS